MQNYNHNWDKGKASFSHKLHDVKRFSKPHFDVTLLHHKSKVCKSGGTYCKIASSNTFCLEELTGFFRLLMKDIFDPYVL